MHVIPGHGTYDTEIKGDITFVVSGVLVSA